MDKKVTFLSWHEQMQKKYLIFPVFEVDVYKNMSRIAG